MYFNVAIRCNPLLYFAIRVVIKYDINQASVTIGDLSSNYVTENSPPPKSQVTSLRCNYLCNVTPVVI